MKKLYLTAIIIIIPLCVIIYIIYNNTKIEAHDPINFTASIVNYDTRSVSISYNDTDPVDDGRHNNYRIYHQGDGNTSDYTSSALSNFSITYNIGAEYGSMVSIVLEACVVGGGSGCTEYALHTKTVIINFNPPDLVVSSLDLSINRILAGGEFNHSIRVNNIGRGISSETELTYYRSIDNIIDTSDAIVGSDNIPALNTPGRWFLDIDLIAEPIIGLYYYGACASVVEYEVVIDNNCSNALPLIVIDPPPRPENLLFAICSDDIVFVDWNSSIYLYEGFTRQQYQFIFIFPDDTETIGNTFFSTTNILSQYSAGQLVRFTVRVVYEKNGYTIQSAASTGNCTVSIPDTITVTPVISTPTVVLLPPVITGLHFDYCNAIWVAADWDTSPLTYPLADEVLDNRVYEYQWLIHYTEADEENIITGLAISSATSIFGRFGQYAAGDTVTISVRVRYGTRDNYVRSPSATQDCTINITPDIPTPTFGALTFPTVTPSCSNDINVCIAPQISDSIYSGPWYNKLPTPQIN